MLGQWAQWMTLLEANSMTMRFTNWFEFFAINGEGTIYGGFSRSSTDVVYNPIGNLWGKVSRRFRSFAVISPSLLNMVDRHVHHAIRLIYWKSCLREANAQFNDKWLPKRICRRTFRIFWPTANYWLKLNLRRVSFASNLRVAFGFFWQSSRSSSGDLTAGCCDVWFVVIAAVWYNNDNMFHCRSYRRIFPTFRTIVVVFLELEFLRGRFEAICVSCLKYFRHLFLADGDLAARWYVVRFSQWKNVSMWFWIAKNIRMLIFRNAFCVCCTLHPACEYFLCWTCLCMFYLHIVTQGCSISMWYTFFAVRMSSCEVLPAQVHPQSLIESFVLLLKYLVLCMR